MNAYRQPGMSAPLAILPILQIEFIFSSSNVLPLALLAISRIRSILSARPVHRLAINVRGLGIIAPLVLLALLSNI